MRPFKAPLFLTVALLGIAGLACSGPPPVAHQAAPAGPTEEERRAAALAELQAMQGAVASAFHASDEAVARRDPAAARAALAAVEPRLADVKARGAGAEAETLLAQLGARMQTVERLEKIAGGVSAAKSVVSDKQKCDTPKEIADAWTLLSEVRPQDPEWKEARSLAAKLERCRSSAERQLTKALKDLMVSQRAEMAGTMERSMLDSGVDVRVTLRGRDKDHIRIGWILMSRVAAHQLTDGGSMEEGALLFNLQRVGFRKVEFHDNYGESWSYTLQPPDESQGGRMSLEPMGLGEPLVLASN